MTNRREQKVLNNSHSHLTKYNRSAYKLKQYISDVNKINAKQLKKNTTKTKKVNGGVLVATKTLKTKNSSDKQLNDSQVYSKKTKVAPVTSAPQQQLFPSNTTQSQLTT